MATPINKEELENKISKLQELQQNIELLRIQVEKVKDELSEVEQAIDVLNKEQLTEVYQFFGKILIRRSKDDTLRELKEKQELLKLRQSGLQRQLEKMQEKAKELEGELRSLIK